jgi:hypothetical protein
MPERYIAEKIHKKHKENEKSERRKTIQRMRKKLLSLLSVVLVGALMLSFLGCLKEKEEKEKMKTLPAGWVWYENETFGIRLAYPEKWEVEPSPYNPDNLYSLNVIEFKHPTSLHPHSTNVVFYLGCKKVEKDFDLNAYLNKQLWWPPDEAKDVKIDGVPGMQFKVNEMADILTGSFSRTAIRTFVVVNNKLFKFFFVEDEIGKTGYQILDSVEFL